MARKKKEAPIPAQPKGELFIQPLEKVLHLKMRHTVSPNPTKKPRFVNASTAYCEQLGVNLQHAGLIGDINF